LTVGVDFTQLCCAPIIVASNRLSVSRKFIVLSCAARVSGYVTYCL